MHRAHTSMAILVWLLVIPIAGCQLGPGALRVSHAQYSEAINRAGAQQMLMNLVRLLYRETPIFLEINAVSAQFVFDKSGEIVGTINENVGAPGDNPNQFRISGNVSYQERPTISYNTLRGEAFVTRLLSPVSLDTISLLTHSGWRADRVLRIATEHMNGLDNAGQASGPTPAEAPEFRDFKEAAQLLAELQRDGTLYFGYQDRDAEVSDPIPAAAVTATAVLQADQQGARLRRTAGGQDYVLTRPQRTRLMGIANGAAVSAKMQRLRHLLRLSDDQKQFELGLGQWGDTRDSDIRYDHVRFNTRSLLGVMFYLSQGVQVPDAHRKAGLVTTTLTRSGAPFDWSEVLEGLFEVRVSPHPPMAAAVAVRHRNYWFYIADDDEDSKSTFHLLRLLFNLQAGDAKSIQPVLTLPVGG